MSYLTHNDLSNRNEENTFPTSNNPMRNLDQFQVNDEEPAFKINELSHRINILENKVSKIENYLHRLSAYQNNMMNKR